MHVGNSNDENCQYWDEEQQAAQGHSRNEAPECFAIVRSLPVPLLVSILQPKPPIHIASTELKAKLSTAVFVKRLCIDGTMKRR